MNNLEGLLIEPKLLKGNKAKGLGFYLITDENLSNSQVSEPNVGEYIAEISKLSYFSVGSFSHSEFADVDTGCTFPIDDFTITNGLSHLTISEQMVRSMFPVKIESFEDKLWRTFSQELKIGSKDFAYAYLFEELRLQVKNRGYKNCNNFLVVLMQENLDSHTIVHVLNVLSPIKNDLYFWTDFLSLSKDRLVELKGQLEANILLKVII